MNLDQLVLLSLAFFLISVIYSSAGFGGGSSYLAILSLFSISFMLMKSTALLCNIVVVSGKLYIFKRYDLMDLKAGLPICLISVPMAFLGGYYPLKEELFFAILGFSLLIAAFILFLTKTRQTGKEEGVTNQGVAFAAGGVLGLLAGLVGIGGGIFLSPVLHFINWSSSKKIAATASLFILLNSISGLIGHWSRETPEEEALWVIPLCAFVLIGGQIGSRLTARSFSNKMVRRITAVLVLIAGGKIIFDQIGYLF